MSQFHVEGKNGRIQFQAKVTHHDLGDGVVIGFIFGEVCPVQKETLAMVKFDEDEDMIVNLPGRSLTLVENIIPHDMTVLNIFAYGSRKYGTASDESDWDYIILVKDCDDENVQDITDYPVQGFRDDINVSIYDQTTFHEGLENMEISIIEAYCSEGQHGTSLPYVNLAKLRSSLSAKASNSWVKGKKKLTVEKDYDPYIAKKSVFHAIRILVFGVHIAKYGRVNFQGANQYWNVIKDLPDDWDTIHKLMKPIYNEWSSEFKKHAPKDGLIMIWQN